MKGNSKWAAHYKGGRARGVSKGCQEEVIFKSRPKTVSQAETKVEMDVLGREDIRVNERENIASETASSWAWRASCSREASSLVKASVSISQKS